MTIYSKSKKNQETILLDLVKSAVACNLCFLVEGYKYLEGEKLVTFISIFKKTRKDNEFINWDIDPLVYQIPEGVNYPIKYISDNQLMTSSDYHRIAVSSISVDDEIAYSFCYEYLKLNNDDIFIPDDVGLTWETMSKIYENGYFKTWFKGVTLK